MKAERGRLANDLWEREGLFVLHPSGMTVHHEIRRKAPSLRCTVSRHRVLCQTRRINPSIDYSVVTTKIFSEAIFPVMTIGENGVMCFDTYEGLHTCFRGFVGSYAGKEVIDSTGARWRIVSVTEDKCLTPFWIRWMRAAVVSLRLEMEPLVPLPLVELKQIILMSLRRGGWAVIMKGLVKEYTARDAKLVSVKVSGADSIEAIIAGLDR